MKKVLLLLAVMLVSIAAQAWTVKFTNPDNWAKVYAWAWNGGTNYTGGKWPGVEMTKSGDVWVYEGEGDPALIIFSNGEGKQTGNLPFVDNSTYDNNGPVGVVVKPQVYLTGSINDWATDNAAYKFSTTDDVNFTFHIDALPAETKVKIFNGKDYLSYDGTPESGVEYTLTDTGMEGQIYFPTAVTDVTFKFNVETNTLTVTYKAGGQVVYPETIYVIGNINGGGFSPINVAALENKGEGLYQGEITFTGGDSETDSWFSFCQQPGKDEEDWSGLGIRYCAPAVDTPATLNEELPYVTTGDNAWQIANGSYKIIFNMVNKTVKLTASTGVAGVEVADEAPVYFNLQGVRVAEPQNGVYVVRRGAKVTKEMIRK